MILGRCHAGVLASVRAMTSSHQRFRTLVHGARPQADWRSLERHAETWRQLDGVERQRRVYQELRQVNTVGTSSPASHRIASHRTALPSLHPTLPVRRRDRSTPTDDSLRNVASGCSVPSRQPRWHPSILSSTTTKQPPVPSTDTQLAPRTRPATPHTIPLLMTARP